MKLQDWYESSPAKYWQPDKARHIEQDILTDPVKYSEYLGTYKMDGNWSRWIIDKDNNIRVQSRTVSKKTGEYGDLTEKVPHLVQVLKALPPETVILGEICYPELNKHSDEVGTILRCLPAKAIARQKDNPLSLYIFDVLMWNGVDIHTQPYSERITYFNKIKETINSSFVWCAEPKEITQVVKEYDDYLDRGGEGFVLVKKNLPYSPGTRTAWSSIKLKQATDEFELVVTGTIDPVYYYNGEDPEGWQYRDAEDNPITKRAYYGWMAGVMVNYSGINVKVTSGCSDEDGAWLASDEAVEMINRGELYAVVRAMQVTKDGSLRHPVLVRLRDDV